jgi:hypothetical protein
MANRSFSGRRSLLFSLTFLTILFWFLPLLTHGAELEDLGASLRVTTANESSSLNSLTRMITSTADVTLTNISEKPFTVPLHAVINISVAGVQMPEALGGVGIAPYEKYYYDLSGQIPGGVMPPGGSVTFRAVFVRYYTVRFTYTVSPYGLTASSTAPQIQISPTSVDFGDVAIGASAVQEITVSNPGDAVLSVASIQGSGSPFTTYPPTSFDLAPGGSQQVRVGFSPETEDSFTGSIGIASNAPGQEQTTVSVSGRGIVPIGQTAISAPTTVEFGAVMEGQSATKDVTVCSTGTTPLSITQANLDNSEFSWAPNGAPSLPLSLAGGECHNLPIAFTPGMGSGGSTREGNLTISSDAGNAGVRLSGSAVTPVDFQTLSVLDARVINGAVYDQIDETTCSTVEGEVRFGEGSRSSDSFVVTLTDQTGISVSSSPFEATQGAGTAIFSGIDACELKDGMVTVTVSLGDDDQNRMTGTPAAKNTSDLAAPILDPIDPATVFSTIKVCGEAPANTLVQINGGSGTVDLQLTNGQTGFCLDVPLRPNTENLLVASATDPARGLVASAAPVKVNQVDPSSVAIAQASSRPLTVEEVETLVEKGVIDLNDPANFNVSMFTIGLNIGGSSFIISQPVVVNSTAGTVSYGVGTGWVGSGYPTTYTAGSAMQVVVIRTPSGQTIPGVIIIDGRIKTLKEFFQVTIAIQNTTALFDLTDMVASISLPAGLSPVKAGPGTDVSSINTGSATDTVAIGAIGPQQTGTGQFIIRGDGIGTHNVTVNFQGFLSGGGLAENFPISGSANTSVQVFGPPKLDVVVRHPGDPDSAEPDVTAGEIYTLTVDVTNRSPIPALYASLQLLIGQGAVLVDGDGNEVLGSSTVRNLGHIQPGQTASQAFRVKSKLTGKILACQALASENINLTVDIGGGDCSIANTIPANFQFPPANAPPAIMAINPLNNQPNLPLSTTIMATLTPQASCLTADTWTNVVTDWIDPNDHDKGVRIVSAELATMGTFYLEELDRFGNPVVHVPVDLTVTAGVDGQTSIAVLRPGLASPLGQSLLMPNTFYRATLVGGDDGICNAGLNSVTLANSFRWTFSTEQTCVGVDAPTATLDQPLNGSTGQPLNQKIELKFSRRMDPASFTFDQATPTNSSFLVIAGGTISGGDISGGTIVPGSATFSNLFQTLTFTPSGNLPEGKTIYVRLKNTIKDVCDNPLQTPDGGILLFSFTTSPPDTTPPDPPAVNPLPALTNQSVIQVSGSAEPGSVVTITGGAVTATVTTSASGLFSTSVRLVTNAGNALQVTAADASNNVSAPIEMDKNGAALTVVHDSVPPTVVSVEPANGATKVANHAAIHVTFSKAINPATVNSLNFKVEGTVPVSGSFTLNGNDGFTFTPASPLESGQTYIVRLRAGGIADTAGNSLTSEYTSLFVIEDGEASTLTKMDPTSGTSGTTFDVTFTGTKLATASAVVSDNPGVSGTITGKSDTSVTAAITIVPQAVTGATTLGLVTDGGTVKLPFTVTAAGTISLANFEVGKNLQVNPVVIFTPAPAAGTAVSITSSDAAKLLLSTSPTAAGSGSLTYTMKGGAAIGDLQAQALEGSGVATVTVSAPGYTPVTATATLRPSGFVITTSDFNTVVGDADTTVTVAARMLNEAMAPTAAGQVRGGIGINVPVTSSDPTVGTIVVNPVTLAGGSSTAATSFHPLAGGSTVISLAPPEGFGTPTSGQGIAATVVGKVITLTAPTTSLVTRNRYPFTVGLAAPAGPGGQPVELAVTTGDMVTIPATVTVPEGKTSVNFDVETALATGTLTLTASAPGFTGDSKALIVAARTFSLYSPLVGIDRTVAARITLDQPAPSGGATFVLSVANPNVATVSPVNLTISAGETIGDFELTGGLTVGLTTLTADGTGSGYISKTLNITATNRLIDVPSGKEVELGTSHVVPVLIAPDPAPAGGVTLTVTSSDPTIVEVLTPTIVIPEGSYQGTIEIRAASGTTGTAVITAANAGFAPDTMQVSLTAGLDILESFANISSTTTGELLLRLVSGGRTYPAAAGGVEIVLSSSDSACVAPPSALTIAEGTSFGTATVGYGGTASLPCTTTVTASNPLFGTDTAQVTIDQSQDLGGITITQLENSSNRIGAGLQSPYRLTLATGNHGGVKVQLKSSDPAVARLSASATNFGLPLIELAIPDGQTSVTFYVQGVRETTGSVTLTAQSPRFTTKTASLAVVQPVFLLTDLTSPTTTLAADDAFYVHTGVLNATGTSFSQYQNVSAQGSLPATFTSSDPAVGQLAKAYERGASVTVNIPVDRHTSPTTVATGGVAFDALADGTTTVTATAPGFDSAWSGAAKVVTVNQPIMIIPDATGIGHRVGASLQVQYHIDLGTIATNHGGVTVHVESSDSGKVRLSNSATTAGSAAIDVPIADGQRYGYFYVQGVRSSTGTAILTATHPLFATATASINVVQPVMYISSLNTSTNPLAADDDFYVYLRVVNAAGTSVYSQNVSGEGPLPVTFTSSDPIVGLLAKTGERGASVTVNIPVNQDNTPTTLANGGVAFDALSAGITTVAATAPGFNSGWSDAAEVVTVNAPAMTIPAPYGIGHRVGASLQLQYSIDLGGTSHGGVTVHVESGDSGKVRLSNSATTAGTAAVDVPIADGQRYGYFYVQGVRGTTGTAVLTATHPLFATATATINVVQPVMYINSLNTSTTPLAADDDFYVNLYVSNAAGTMYSQSVSGEGPLPVTFTSGDPAVGQLAKTGERGASVTVNIQVNQDNSPTTLATGGVAFDALAGGTATVEATAPGFNNEYSQSSKVVTVNPSALTIADTTGIGNRVGASLQVQYRIDLGGTNHGGVTVHVESGDSGKVQLSNSATTAGAAAIDVPIADGERYGYFYVQGVRSSTGTAILTATHPLFATATASINVVQPVMYISSLNTSTNPLAADDDFYVYLRVLNAAGTSVYSQNVSGEGPLPVTFTSSDPIVGLLAKTGERGASVTVNIPVNQDSTPTTLANGGVAFDALSSGITTLAATAPGFNNAYSQASQTVTVKPLAITITDVDNDTFRVGGGLQTRYRITLNSSTHGGVTVRVASGDTTRVLLAPDATTPGTSFIDLFIANGQTTKDFYVRGMAGVTGTVTLTATSPLFTTGSAEVEVVRAAVRITDVETVTYRVGGGLQNRYRITLDDPAYGGVTVRVASSDTSRSLLAPDATTPGTSFVDLVFADGQTTKDFHVQGINGVTGMATINATSPIFNSGTAAVEVVRSAIRIEGLNTSMTASAANDPFYVSSGILDAVGISFAKTQTVSPAGPIQVLLTSGNAAVGQLLTNVAGGAQVTVSVPVNGSVSPGTKAAGGVEFDPLTAGSTTVSATVNGFNNDWSGAKSGITVTP